MVIIFLYPSGPTLNIKASIVCGALRVFARSTLSNHSSTFCNALTSVLLVTMSDQ